MNLAELLSSLPPIKAVPDARQQIAQRLVESRSQVIVLDDDPTGTQTVHGVQVHMDWSVNTLRNALTSGNTASFISANTRAMMAVEADSVAYEIGKNIRSVCELENITVRVASRSDSTLRGHFPNEVESLMQGLGWNCDGVVLAPALFEAGRYTVKDVHYVDQGDSIVPASETEFARDPTFSYLNSDLKLWVEEKTRGRLRPSDVVSVSIDDIRLGGPDTVSEKLMSVHGGSPVVVNATCYEDLEVFMLGLLEAEEQGKLFIYRCAAPFVKVRSGIVDRPLLTREEIGLESDGPGLIVTGSYVGKTSRQLEVLISSGLVVGEHIDVKNLLDERSREAEIARVARWIDDRLRAGQDAAVFTSRTVLESENYRFLDVGKLIMSGVCEIVRRSSLRPSFVIAKGGITSIEVARAGLNVKSAAVLGQVLPGVPVWQLGSESKWPVMPYVVFPGNVGTDTALLDALRVLRGK